jgi:hypothetical protein
MRINKKKLTSIMRARASVLVVTLFVLSLLSGIGGLRAAWAKNTSHWVVTPSGDMDGVEDAIAIELALRMAKGGGVVELLAGDYYVGRAIDVPNFSGTLHGAGKDQTTIHVVENIEPGSFVRHVPYWDGWNGMTAEYALLFNFDIPDPNGQHVRSISIMDMTIKVVADPADPHDNCFVGMTTSLNNVAYISGGSFDTRFENLRIEGGLSEYTTGRPSVNYPLGVAGGRYPDVSTWPWVQPEDRGEGHHQLVNVDFVNVAMIAYEGCCWKSGSFLVTGCTFTNVVLPWWIGNNGPDVIVTIQ